MSYSGLWDGVYTGGYTAVKKSTARPQMQRGIIRVFMQKTGMWGHVNALGRNTPDGIVRTSDTVAQRDNVYKGTFEYNEDPALRVSNRDLPLINHPQHEVKRADMIDHARPADADETDLVSTYDTTIRNGYPGDAAVNGVTGGFVQGETSDGS